MRVYKQWTGLLESPLTSIVTRPGQLFTCLPYIILSLYGESSHAQHSVRDATSFSGGGGMMDVKQQSRESVCFCASGYVKTTPVNNDHFAMQ